jgi:hypothetical protein
MIFLIWLHSSLIIVDFKFNASFCPRLATHTKTHSRHVSLSNVLRNNLYLAFFLADGFLPTLASVNNPALKAIFLSFFPSPFDLICTTSFLSLSNIRSIDSNLDVPCGVPGGVPGLGGSVDRDICSPSDDSRRGCEYSYMSERLINPPGTVP